MNDLAPAGICTESPPPRPRTVVLPGDVVCRHDAFFSPCIILTVSSIALVQFAVFLVAYSQDCNSSGMQILMIQNESFSELTGASSILCKGKEIAVGNVITGVVVREMGRALTLVWGIIEVSEKASTRFRSSGPEQKNQPLKGPGHAP
jgi:hypothetical protein